MPEKMPTIAEFARTLGVSKSNVVNKIKELELETVTKPGDKRRCQYLPERTCSALADKLAKLLMDQLAAAEGAAAETARQSQAHIDDLKAQAERLEAENRDLKSQLSLSRALEGFHFPWTRDRIKARYLLPGSDSNQ